MGIGTAGASEAAIGAVRALPVIGPSVCGKRIVTKCRSAFSWMKVPQQINHHCPILPGPIPWFWCKMCFHLELEAVDCCKNTTARVCFKQISALLIYEKCQTIILNSLLLKQRLKH